MTESDYLAKVLVELVGNPIHVYSLMDRLVMQLPVLRKELEEHLGTDNTTESIRTLVEEIEMPEEMDLEGVTQALARIQFAYRLDPVELAGGKIKDTQTEGRLSVKQMMNIAERRISGAQPMRPAIGKEYALAIEWAEAAKVALESSRKDNKHLEDTIRSFVEQTKKDYLSNTI